MRFSVLLFLFLSLGLASSQLYSQVHCTKSNRALCEKTLLRIGSAELGDNTMQDIAVQVGKYFLGTPYVAKTLEITDREQLVIDLGGLDCTTFLENIVVFSRLAKQDKLSFESFQQELELIRYRSGKLDEYPSRLHYFTEWILDNESKGILKDITGEIGGMDYPKSINFMSTHRSAYKQLSSDSFLSEIQKAEQRLNQHKRYYIPKNQIQSFESSILGGDIIAITTSIKGLDVSHVGLAYRKGERIHLLHASTRSDKVEITDVPLSDYLGKSKSQSGIMVCRLQAP